nr:copia protein [Tanacetum cinerariifolium]
IELKGYLLNDGYADLVQHADKKELAIPGKTATGKEFSNPLMAGSLPKTKMAPTRITTRSSPATTTTTTTPVIDAQLKALIDQGIADAFYSTLVAQGHREEEGIDYDDVFAHVARIEAIKLFLAYASFVDFTMYQMYVKSAFLYGTIEEEVYVSQPPGFVDPEFPDRVYKVEKALYGLHQAPGA